jgi:hypothetical protein
MRNKKLFIAIDIGGTYARVASLNSLISPEFKKKNFKLTHNFKKDFKELNKAIGSLAGKRKIEAIGAGLPGELDLSGNKLILAPNLPEWINKNIKEKLSQNFDCEVYLENDATASGLGEAIYGSKPRKDFIFMVWGTGIGGGIVKIKPRLSAKIINFKKYLQKFEDKCGGKNLIKKYKKSPSKFSQEIWAKVMQDFEGEVVNLSRRLKIKNIIIGGGAALKNKHRLNILTKKLKQVYNINFRTTHLGNNHTFCLYGPAALIKLNRYSKNLMLK